MTHQGGLADPNRRRPTRANHRQTTLGAWPRSKLEANWGGRLLEAAWRLLVGGILGHLGGSRGDLESALEAIEGVLIAMLSTDGPKKDQESGIY